MRHLIGPMAMAIILAISPAAWAQDSGAADTQTDDTAPDVATENGTVPSESESADGGVPGLSMGTPANPQNQPYVKETHGDWELRCVRVSQDAEICQLYQLMRDGEGNSVAEFNVFPLPEGQQAAAGANVVTPLETLLTANLRLAVDGGQAKVYPYSFCSPAGCFSRIGLTAEEIAAFQAGRAATITIVPAAAPNETVELTLSLSGFTAGYRAVLETEKARLSEGGSE